MKQKWKERAGRIAGKIADRFADLGYWLEDLYCEYRLRAKKAKRKREKLRKTLSEEEFKRYRRKELLQTVLKGAGAVFCVAAVILLLGFGISKLVRLAGGALSSLRQTEAVTEQPVTETEPVFAERISPSEVPAVCCCILRLSILIRTRRAIMIFPRFINSSRHIIVRRTT